MKTGAERIVAERQRQIDVEEFTSEHDDGNDDGQLELAACCYATPILLYRRGEVPTGSIVFSDPWPADWDRIWDTRARRDASRLTPGARIRCLEKAGALIAAEIDRLLRLNP